MTSRPSPAIAVLSSAARLSPSRQTSHPPARRPRPFPGGLPGPAPRGRLRPDHRTGQRAASQPATSQPATAPATAPVEHLVSTTQGGGLLLNFKDASIDAVLDQLSEAGGFIIVRETSVSGRISLLSKQPVSRDEAVSLLNTVLKNNGYAAIQMGRTLKIVARDRAKKANIPVRSGNDPKEIAETDELITQVIPIRYADAVQLKNDLTPLINTEADVTANASSNSILVTDTSANVRRLVTIISSLDTHLADASDVKVYQLKYAAAAGAAKLINDVFGQTTNTRGAQGGGGAPGGGFNPFQNRGGGGGGAPGGFGGGGFGGFRAMLAGQAGAQNQAASSAGRRDTRVTASSDDRTNTLVVAGPTDTLAVVERVVKELDANPVEDESVFIYNLKNGQSDNLASVLNSLINGGTSGAAGNRSATGGTSNRSSANRNSGFGANSGRSGGSSGGFGGGGGGGSSAFGSFGSTFGSAFGSAGTASRSLSASSASAASDLAGQVTVVSNDDTNSLLVMTAPKNFDRVRMIIADLDRPVPQVLIKVLVAEVTHTNASDLGAEFSVLNLRPNGNGTQVGTDSAGKLNPGFGETSASGGLVARVVEDNMTATIRALQTNNKLDVLSRPYILTSDNQQASIIIGQSVPYPTNSRITDTGQTINSLSYRDVGIILNVTPHINPDGLVTLDVNPEVSSIAAGNGVPISPGVSAPIFNQRASLSRVAIVDGQTIVIGGMMSDNLSSNVDKIPLLGDIPGIGVLFQRKTSTKTKTELLFFLTPHVASRPEYLNGMAKDEMKGTKLTPNAVEPGAFQEHMRGMQRGTTQPVDK